MDDIKRQEKSRTGKLPSSTKHHLLQKSATLNRKFVKKPALKAQIIKKSQTIGMAQKRRKTTIKALGLAKLSKFNAQTQIKSDAKISIKKVDAKTSNRADTIAPATQNPAVIKANATIAARKTQQNINVATAQELKERAIKQAMQQIASMDNENSASSNKIAQIIPKKKATFQTKKFFAAAVLSLASIAALGYLIHLNLPDLSVKVAAIQSGIESAYPSYLPKGFALNDLVSEKDGKIIMTFDNSVTKESFSIAEQKSPWDSTALLTQYVIPNWGNNYTLAKEQGLTIYISDSCATWVSGGVFYLIEAPNNTFTKQQVRDIVISL